jgi:hypothetical protein
MELELSFEKSSGALGVHGPRWDPFVNARRTSRDLDKAITERARTHYADLSF